MKSLSDIYGRCNFCIVKRESFEEVVRGEWWRKDIEVEIEVIEKNKTRELVKVAKDKEVIGVKWIYKVKYNVDGKVPKKK